ncbi:MAG TPA: GNAT family N-acetyltransferase [Geminicoccus sp.]|jgi:phosphinothricin acetyltransferase|uniref:GNAT family N-acetyltransferase n=1 Tax=Geminicoccus sp. TaxID=2024832 RepID=UPI002E2F827E|nr:N-acetyltransferase family protein [Geminicoccus sp.]HEX2528175.1 GNAT family N-acetyltransferase [Geminicoccus sp.]
MVIRDASSADLQACQAIYAYWVDHGTGSFELEPPDLAELQRRHAEVVGRGLPWLVALDQEGAVWGYAYANWFRPRPAYRFAAETSIYVDPEKAGQGIGRALLATLLQRCEAKGIRQAIAVIGDSENAGSIGLHAALGFEHTGAMRSTGWKFGRWLDVVIMQKELGAGAATPPG